MKSAYHAIKLINCYHSLDTFATLLIHPHNQQYLYSKKVSVWNHVSAFIVLCYGLNDILWIVSWKGMSRDLFAVQMTWYWNLALRKLFNSCIPCLLVAFIGCRMYHLMKFALSFMILLVWLGITRNFSTGYKYVEIYLKLPFYWLFFMFVCVA